MHLGSRCPSRPVWCQPGADEAAAEPSGQTRHPPVVTNDQAHFYGVAVLTGHEEVSAEPVLAEHSLSRMSPAESLLPVAAEILDTERSVSLLPVMS